MKPPDPTAAGTLNCTGVVPELFKFATGAIIKVAPRYQSHPILRYLGDAKTHCIIHSLFFYSSSLSILTE
jgi:hypothetical protein